MADIMRWGELQDRLRAHWTDIAHITVHEVGPLFERPHAKLHLSVDGLKAINVLAKPETNEACDGVLGWLKATLLNACPEASQPYKWRVRGYLGGAAGCPVDKTVVVHPEAAQHDTTYHPPTTPEHALEQRFITAAKDLIDLSLETARGAVAVTASTSQDMIAHLRTENRTLHETNGQLRGELAGKDRIIEQLTRRVVDRDRLVIEAERATLEGQRDELEEKAKSADALDRFERIASRVFDIQDMPKEAHELMPLLKDPHVIATLTDPAVRTAMADPDNRRLLMQMMRDALNDAAEEA